MVGWAVGCHPFLLEALWACARGTITLPGLMKASTTLELTQLGRGAGAGAGGAVPADGARLACAADAAAAQRAHPHPRGQRPGAGYGGVHRAVSGYLGTSLPGVRDHRSTTADCQRGLPAVDHKQDWVVGSNPACWVLKIECGTSETSVTERGNEHWLSEAGRMLPLPETKA